MEKSSVYDLNEPGTRGGNSVLDVDEMLESAREELKN